MKLDTYPARNAYVAYCAARAHAQLAKLKLRTATKASWQCWLGIVVFFGIILGAAALHLYLGEHGGNVLPIFIAVWIVLFGGFIPRLWKGRLLKRDAREVYDDLCERERQARMELAQYNHNEWEGT